MEFKKLTEKARNLLGELTESENPVQLLCDRMERSSEEKQEIKNLINELVEANYIKVNWANNKPYIVTITNTGRSYEDRLVEYESSKEAKIVYIQNNSIAIGNINKISKSNIAGKIQERNVSSKEKRMFFERHPWISTFIASFLVGFILLLSFWKDIIMFLEGFFNG